MDKRAVERELEERLALEILVADLAAGLAQAEQDDLDGEVANAQRRICDCLAIDVCAIWQLKDEEPNTLCLTHVYARKGDVSTAVGLEASAAFPWVEGQLRSSRTTFMLSSLDELSPQAETDRRTFAALAIESSLCVPSFDTDGLLRGVVACNCLERRNWSPVVVSRVEMLSRIVLLVLDRATKTRALKSDAKRMRVLNEMLDEAPAGIIVHDEEGRLLYANKKAADIHGLTPESLLSKRLIELIPPVERGKLAARIGRVQRFGASVFEVDHERKDGRRIPLQIALRSVEWHGRPAILSVQTDLTNRRAAEAALRESEATLHAMIDCTSDFIWSVESSHFGLLTFNNALRDYFSRERQIALRPGMSPETLFPTAEDAAMWRRLYERALWDGAYTLECRTFTHGRTLELNFNVLERGDEVFGISVFGKDVTEQQHAQTALQASEDKFRKVFMTGLDAVYIARLDDGMIVDCNDQFAKVFGYSRDEALGKTSVELDLYEDPKDRELVLSKLKTEGSVRDMELKVQKKNGALAIVSISLSPLDTGEVPHILGVARDITEQRRAQEELERHRKHLEDLVRERTAELHAARHAAENASRAKSDFLANMSHEIRTPMNAVLGFAQLLLRDPATTPTQRRHLETISRSGDHLLSLIDGILQLAKVESGRMSLVETTFDLWALVDEVECLFGQRAMEKGLELVVERREDVPRLVLADEGKLRQVLSNLLSNALKFTSQGGVALRACAQGPTYATKLVVEVEDTGAGIAPEEMSRLFNKFEQTATGRASGKGTGLGLAISRQLLELMGGKIEAKSTLGHGSTFRFEIPVGEGDASAIERKTTLGYVGQIRSASPGKRVLVVDDLDENRAFLTSLLDSIGFETRQASNGEEAVREFAIWSPHLIMMDIRMPQMDGIEAVRRVRAMPGGAEVRIMCVTASAFDEDRDAARHAGVDDFLSKPVREDALFEKLRTLLGVRYEYTTTTPPSHPPARGRSSLTPTNVALVEPELREQLRQATLSADLDRMLVLIDRVKDQHTAAAAELEGLAKGFAYERILDVLRGEKQS
jgi:PAS domain S-box-containing protein